MDLPASFPSRRRSSDRFFGLLLTGTRGYKGICRLLGDVNVAILGAGYAGVTAARRLEGSLPDEVELVVVNDRPEHLVRHEVHRVIRRPDFAEEVLVDLDELLDAATVRIERVESVDPDAGRAVLEDEVLEYDYAAVCLGAETAFYDLPGVEEHARPLRSVEHARQVRWDVLDVIENGGGRVVVGGGGLSGIQVAGEVAALAREEDAADIEVLLVERLETVAPGFRSDFQSALREALDSNGVDVRVDTAIESAGDETISTENGELHYDTFVWTGGIRGPKPLGSERLQVRSDLRISDTTFVVGDAGRVVDRDGEAVPATAQAAIKEAEVAATNIDRLVSDDAGTFDPRLRSVDFSPRAWVVSVGDATVAQIGPTILRGSPALAVKATAGVGYLSSVGAVERAVEVARTEFDSR